MTERIEPTQQQIDAHLAYSTAQLLNNGVGELFRADEAFNRVVSSEQVIDEVRSFVSAEAPITVVTLECPKLGWNDTLAIGKIIGGETALHMLDVVELENDGAPRISVNFLPNLNISVDSPLVQAVLNIKEAQEELGWRPESPLLPDVR